MWSSLFHFLLLLDLTIPATFLTSLLDQLQLNPVETTSVYTEPHLLRQMFCGTNSSLLAVNITLLGYNNTRL